MKKAFPFFVIFLLCISARGQQQTPTAAASPEAEVVKITTKLVQFDFLVVDKDGAQVQGLKAEDFEVLQDGKPQKITNFSYINTATGQIFKLDKKSSAPPPPKVTSANAGRILTFIVDDGNCAVSNIGIRASREGIEKFIKEQMQSTDMVAIYQTRSGSSMFQQYTNNKEQLLKAARKIQWYPPTGSCSSSDGSFYAAARSNTYIKQSALGTTTNTAESESDRQTREHFEDAVRNNQIVGTLGVIRYVVQGLQRVSGRKVVFLLSDGMPFRDRSGDRLSAADVLRDLTDLSNRSSVIFNTIDSRGLFDETMIEARDEVYAQDNVLATDNIRNDRIRDVRESRAGLRYLADETGGTFYEGQNFLDKPIGQALKRETGYYLVGYEPTEETFKGKKFNKIEIKTNQPGLKIVSRSGFLGFTDEPAKPKQHKSADSELYEAIVAPLPRAGLNVHLTAYFVNSPESGSVVRSLVHLDGSEITFVDEKDGLKKAVFDVVAVTMDEKNKVVDEFTRTHTYKVDSAAIPTIIKNGLIYSTDVPIKKAGTYNFRVAVRDSTSKQLGSSSQIVEIPDLKKTKLFISALTVAQVDANGKFAIPTAVSPENALTLTISSAVPAIRRFKRGAILGYAYTIYNAQIDPASGEPRLSIQTKLYHDGQIVLEGTPQMAQLEKQADWVRIKDYSYLRLTPQIAPGDYALQIIVKDTLSNGKSATTSQWVDFEITE